MRMSMRTPHEAFTDVRPATECLDLLVPPVADAVRGWGGPVPVDEVRDVDTDPAVADTAPLVAAGSRTCAAAPAVSPAVGSRSPGSGP